MDNLSNAVTPTFNNAISQFSEEDPQTNANLIDIANKAVASFGSSVAKVAGKGEVILGTEEQWQDGVVRYDSDIAVVIKDGNVLWVGRGLQKPQQLPKR
tara:strand:- start:4 stop:300 length:297 start_codon:yes stop_codon:yes gene_type:complete